MAKDKYNFFCVTSFNSIALKLCFDDVLFDNHKAIKTTIKSYIAERLMAVSLF